MAVPRRSNIEALRVETGLKRTPFAERVGISYNHLWGIECGGHVAARETLQVIARELSTLLGRPVPLNEVMVDNGDGGSENAPDAGEAAETETETASSAAQGTRPETGSKARAGAA